MLPGLRILARRCLPLFLALPFGACLTVGGQDPGFDLVLRGGVVYDGAGGEPYRADLAILGKRIAALGDLREARALRTIDVSGFLVVPGFVGVSAKPGADVSEAVDGGVTTLVLPPASVRSKQRRRGVRLNLVGSTELSPDPVPPLTALLETLSREDPRALAETVRDLTHGRMQALGLVGRGLLMPGYFADLAVLDLGVNSNEKPPAPGSAASARVVRSVYVNGEPVVRDGKRLPERPGRLLETR